MRNLTLIGLIAFHVATCTSGPAFATSGQPHGKTDAAGLRHGYKACLDAGGSAFGATQDCIGAEGEYQDARLNRIYKALMASLPADGRTRLRAEERKWIAYRDSHCAFDPQGGQAQRLASNDCSVEQTAKRATVLEGRRH